MKFFKIKYIKSVHELNEASRNLLRRHIFLNAYVNSFKDLKKDHLPFYTFSCVRQRMIFRLQGTCESHFNTVSL